MTRISARGLWYALNIACVVVVVGYVRLNFDARLGAVAVATLCLAALSAAYRGSGLNKADKLDITASAVGWTTLSLQPMLMGRHSALDVISTAIVVICFLAVMVKPLWTSLIRD